MEIKEVHSFQLTQNEMIVIQTKLASQIQFKEFDINQLNLVAGIDVSYKEETAVCSIVTIDFHTLEILDVTNTIAKPKQNYKSGFLAFRELPSILSAWKKLKINPDIVLFDGHGYLHPRRCGLASHASFFINRPTIGIGKNYLIGKYQELDTTSGSYEYITENEQILGVVFRSKTNVKPIYVSVGNFIKLDQSINIVNRLINPKLSKLPLPIYHADKVSREILENTVE